MNKLIPTAEQEAILEAMRTQRHSIMLSADAGCAKTSTMVMLAQAQARLAPLPAVCMAFNKKTAEELALRMPPSFQCKTMNGLGYGAWASKLDSKLKLADWKISDLLKAHCGLTSETFEDEEYAEIISLVNKARNAGIIPESYASEHQGIVADEFENWAMLSDLAEPPEPLIETAREILRQSVEQAMGAVVDFDDMIYMSCQPAGTLVRKTIKGVQGSWETPIEQLKAGDYVVSFERRRSIFVGQYSHGSLIQAVGKRKYTGTMYEILAGSLKTQATEEHKWLVRFGQKIKRNGLFFTYIMLKDGSFRIGYAQAKAAGPGGTDRFGPCSRAFQEKADAVWVLGTHSTVQDAKQAEACIVAQFGITDVCYDSILGRPVHNLQRTLADHMVRGIKCIEAFGRKFEYPFFTPNVTRGMNTNFIVESCNLISGLMEVPTFQPGKSEPFWETLYTNTQPVVDVDVYSLSVARHELYVANNILTHNCLYGGKFKQFPLVLVDEAQDLNMLNHIQVGLIARDRIVAVGDPKQAIYAFRGADCDSMRNMRALRPQWIDLPLHVTFRCPQSVVRRQQAHAPGFRAAPSNPEGEVISWIKEDGAVSWNGLRTSGWTWKWLKSLCELGEKPFVISRNNAPLLRMAFRCIRMGVYPEMLGRDIGKGLIALAKKISPKDGVSLESFLELVERWENGEIRKAKEAKRNWLVSGITDRAESLRAVAETMTAGGAPKTVKDLQTAISALFRRESGDLRLATGHRAKGLEDSVVMHLDPWRLPSRYAVEAAELGDMSQLRQERNLQYVIETRTRRVLVLANVDDFIVE